MITLPHLEAFGVAPYRKEPVNFSRLLPFNYESTLTKYDILFTEWQSDHVDEMKLLINFVHITDLGITPMTTAMCQVLVGCSLRLNSSSTQSYFPHQPYTGPLLDLLSSPVLAEATTLRYDYIPRKVSASRVDTRLIFEPFIELVTNLPDLEEVELGYPAHEQWFQKFRGCINLREIVWDYSNFPTKEIPFHSEAEDTRLTEALLEALNNLGTAPDVVVHSFTLRYAHCKYLTLFYGGQKEAGFRATAIQNFGRREGRTR